VIRSETLEDPGAVKVTFTLSHAGLDGRTLAVVGDFNDWDSGAAPMEHHNGHYTVTLTLPRGRYRFRYLSRDGRWFNDDAAHGYEENDHGGHDSVLDITGTTDDQVAQVEESAVAPGAGAAGSAAPLSEASAAGARLLADPPPGLPGVTEPADPDLPSRSARGGRRKARAAAADPGRPR
jgi:hypothetical protein